MLSIPADARPTRRSPIGSEDSMHRSLADRFYSDSAMTW